MRFRVLLLALVALPAVARADLLWDLRVGAKGAVTGDLWTAPDDALPGGDPFWGDTQFYVGGGGGAFVELHVLTFLGLEVDVLYQRNAFRFDQTISGFEYRYTTSFDQLRIPVLVKGILPLGPVELSLGVGPEFVVGLGSRVSVDYRTRLQPAQEAYADSVVRALYGAREASATFLAAEVGVAIRVWKLAIPISLRLGANLTQPAAHEDRVAFEWAGAPYTSTLQRATVDGIESFQFSLLAGVAYVF